VAPAGRAGSGGDYLSGFGFGGGYPLVSFGVGGGHSSAHLFFSFS
jgi:hypothetical protein